MCTQGRVLKCRVSVQRTFTHCSVHCNCCAAQEIYAGVGLLLPCMADTGAPAPAVEEPPCFLCQGPPGTQIWLCPDTPGFETLSWQRYCLACYAAVDLLYLLHRARFTPSNAAALGELIGGLRTFVDQFRIVQATAYDNERLLGILSRNYDLLAGRSGPAGSYSRVPLSRASEGGGSGSGLPVGDGAESAEPESLHASDGGGGRGHAGDRARADRSRSRSRGSPGRDSI